MAMTALESDTLQAAFAACQILQVTIQPRLAALQAQYDSAGGVKETLTQANLDEQPALSKITKQQVDDGLYCLTAVILPALAQNYAILAHLTARHRGMGATPMMTPAPMI